MAKRKNKVKPYHLVLHCVDGTWCMENGFYEKTDAKSELEDMKYHAERGTKKNFKIVKIADAKQKTIVETLKTMNKGA